MKEPDLIQLRAVSRRHDTGLLALDGLDLRLAPGEFVGVVGPSACGKSSLLRLLNGQHPPSQGEVLFKGQPLRGPAPATSVLYRDPALLPWADVQSNVELPLRQQGLAADARAALALAALQSLGLDALAGQRIKDLNTAQRVLVGLARALVTQPELLLLDDPLANLDETTRLPVQQALLTLWQARAAAGQPLTVVLLTRWPDHALSLGQRVLVLGGRPGRWLAELKLPQPVAPDTPGWNKALARIDSALAQAPVAELAVG